MSNDPRLHPRPSNHAEPHGLRDAARHYSRDLVYGALDGVITTFAAVAAVAGGALPTRTVLIVGLANLMADGFSMAVGNYLSIKTDEGARAAVSLPELEASPARHGLATFAAFAMIGAVPLLPYVWPVAHDSRLPLAIGITLVTLFGVGALRSVVTVTRWWVNGAEMLGLGVIVAAVAYGVGRFVASLTA